MMLAPSDRFDIDLVRASEVLGDVIRSSDEMLEFMYEGIKLTLYPNGSLMFYHFNDVDEGHVIADDVLRMACASFDLID